MENWFRKKPKENLERQTQEVNTTIETSISQKSQGEGVYSLSIEEIKSQYPERYAVYLSLLRAERSGQEVDQDELNSMKEWMTALNNLDDYIENHKSVEGERVLRDRQFTVFEDIRNSLEQGKKEGYVKLPTGVGKTVLFSQVIESMSVKTLVVVPSKILIGQTGEKLEEFTDLDYGKYYSEIKDTSKNTTIITYPSLIKSIEEGKINPDDYGLLILDEAHKSLGEKTQQFIKKFNAVKIGFTATPEYSKDRHVDELLGHEIHSMSIVEAVREKLICRFKSIFAFTETDLSDVKVVNGNYDVDELEKVVNIPARNLSAVKLYKEMFDGQLAVAYCSGVSHAKDLTELFLENGISAEVISGKTSEKEREKILQRFNSGETKVLCNARVLIEGFDEPKASVALNLHPTLSKVDAEQRSGRVLRNDPDDLDKWATVVDFIDKNSEKPAITFPNIANASEASSERIVDKDFVKKEKASIGEESEERIKVPPPVIEGLRVVVDTEEILQISSELEDQRNSFEIENPPEGWLTLNKTSEVVGQSWPTIKDFVEPYRDKHPEWFKVYRAGVKGAEHYSPELIEILKNSLVNKKDWIGWVNTDNIQKQVSVGLRTIASFVDQYREKNPEWFRIYKSAKTTSEYYSPELFELFKQEFLIETAPAEGWIEPAKLGEDIHSKRETIMKYAEQYRSEHPEWFKVFRSNTSGRRIEHYSKELETLVREALDYQEAPEGWASPKDIQNERRAKGETVLKFVERYRTTNPEWFKKYKKATKVIEYFSPELVRIVREKFPFKQDLDGWVSLAKISDQLMKGTETIKNFVDQYRSEHPEWFKMTNLGTHEFEVFSPILVTKIRENLVKDKAPEGWKNIVDLIDALSKDRRTILRFVEKYRTSNPEWFKTYFSQRKEMEYFSPELVKIIETTKISRKG